MRAQTRSEPKTVEIAELGPWGDAIDYWLREKGLRQSDLVRLTGLQAKTVSKVARGHDTQTSVLRRIATAFGIAVDFVLVSPLRRGPNGARRELVREVLAETMRFAEPENVDEATIIIIERIRKLTVQQRNTIEGLLTAFGEVNDHAIRGKTPSLRSSDGSTAARRRRRS